MDALCIATHRPPKLIKNAQSAKSPPAPRLRTPVENSRTPESKTNILLRPVKFLIKLIIINDNNILFSI